MYHNVTQQYQPLLLGFNHDPPYSSFSDYPFNKVFLPNNSRSFFDAPCFATTTLRPTTAPNRAITSSSITSPSTTTSRPTTAPHLVTPYSISASHPKTTTSNHINTPHPNTAAFHPNTTTSNHINTSHPNTNSSNFVVTNQDGDHPICGTHSPTNNCFAAFVVHVHTAFSYDLDIQFPDAVREKYSGIGHSNYKYKDRKCSDVEKDGSAYRCRISSVRLAPNLTGDDRVKTLKQVKIRVFHFFAQSNDWIFCEIIKIDQYKRLIVNVYDINKNGSLSSLFFSEPFSNFFINGDPQFGPKNFEKRGASRYQNNNWNIGRGTGKINSNSNSNSNIYDQWKRFCAQSSHSSDDEFQLSIDYRK